MMYHYVFNKGVSENLNGIAPLWEDDFRKQLGFLDDKYEIVNPYDFINNVNNYDYLFSKTEKEKCIITFDDGTKDQFDLGVKVLDEFKIKGLFFVLSDVLENHTIPLSHLLHKVLCDYDANHVINYMIDLGCIKEIDSSKLFSESQIYHYEKDKSRRILKFIVNYKLYNKYDYLKDIFISILGDGTTEELLSKQWFSSYDDVYSAYSNGHMIGNHGKSHKSYESLSMNEIRDEIIDSHNVLNSMFGGNVNVFAHPQGGDSGEKNRFVALTLKKLDYSACFNASNKKNIISCDGMDINRIDAALVYPNKNGILI